MDHFNKDNSKLVGDVGELSSLFIESRSLETFLEKTVELIAGHMNADVCSIYLFYEDTRELILTATKGLNRDFLGNIRLKLGEGLTGVALKELRPICERQASTNTNFRYFPGLGEEKYESFLAVPMARGTNRIGVLVIQNTEKNYFTDEDTRILQAINSQIVNTIELIRLFIILDKKSDSFPEVHYEKNLKFVKGRVGSQGVVLAPAVILPSERELRASGKKQFLRKFGLEDFRQAVQKTEKELEKLQEEIEETLSDVASLIFSAQILMLKDHSFVSAIEKLIEGGLNAPQAVIEVVEDFVGKFENIPNPYLREKQQDVRDIGRRLLNGFSDTGEEIFNYDNCIVIARDLYPSDALKLSSQKVKGIILLSGGVTSHLSLLARSLQIPLVIAEEQQLLSIPDRTQVLLDAEQGHVYINPSPEIIASFQEKEEARSKLEKPREGTLETTQTKDGTKIMLMANINLLGDLKNAVDFKAQGVGLYRSEFPFIVRSDFPSEEEQFVIYKKIVDGMPGKEITFRTLDIGGDKVLSYYQHHVREKNPYLGMRSIRFSLKHIDIFAQQIRAILRAGPESDMRIMFPMISSVDEFRQAKNIVISCIKSLQKENVPCHSRPKIGLMIELPAVMEILDALAREADFFSIGTNDFIQYMLAVDRTNEKVADLYLPYHPSVLRAFKKIVDTARKHKKDISVCGDMAHDEKYLQYFLGIGVRKLSLNPRNLPKIQEAVRSLYLKEAQKSAGIILRKSRLDEIRKIMNIPQ